MPTTGKFSSRLLAIYTGAGAGTKITHQTDASLSIGSNTIDVTTKDSAGWEESIYGNKNWEMSGSAVFAFDAANGHSSLLANITAGTTVTVLLTTAITGDKKWSGTALVTKLDLNGSGSGDDAPSYSYSLKGTGALTEATV